MLARSFVISVIVLSFVFALDARSVYACSGRMPPLTIKGLLAQSDYMVKARAIESDDAGQNTILQVQSYLSGGPGPEFLLFSRLDPVFTEYILAGRSSGGDCLGLASALHSSDSFYAFLRRNENGSYSLASTLFNFPQIESTVEVFLEGGFQDGDQILEDVAEWGTGQWVSEREFVALIAVESGEEPKLPDPTYHYPLKSPLLVTTSGEQFVLPADWGTPVLVTEEMNRLSRHPMYTYGFSDALRCAEFQDDYIISPDNLNIAVLRSDATICFTWGHKIEGQAILFSSSSDSVAVWDQCDLLIYSTGYPLLLQTWYELKTVNRHEIAGNNCEQFHNAAVWHPNGRILAYSDQSGLWLWDALSPQSDPNLILTNESDLLVLPNHFSPLGSYLNYTTGQRTGYVDILTGEVRPNGLFSGNERHLINLESDPTASGYEICTQVEGCAYASGRPMYLTKLDEDTGEVMAVYAPDDIRQTLWESNSTFLQLACTSDEKERCGIYRWSPYIAGWESSLISTGIGFDYDPATGLLAILYDDQTIIVDGIEYDMTAVVNSPITSISWLPSIFYYD